MRVHGGWPPSLGLVFECDITEKHKEPGLLYALEIGELVG